MWWRKWRAKKGRPKRKAAQMVQLILFIISLHPKKITDEQIHSSLPHRNMKLVPVTYFFLGFPHSLWYEAFDFHNVPLLSLCNGPFSLLTRWMKTNRRVRRCLAKVIGKKNITSFRAAKNPLLWRHNDLKFNLFCVHLYEKSTMIHLK